MIIAKAPLRMSFTGGGSDLPSFYRRFGGAVISTAIDKYVYVTVNKRFDDHIRVSYSKTEIVDDVNKLNHNLVRESLRKIGIKKGIEITSIADISGEGSGLGSSSTFTTALIHALHVYNRKYINANQIAESVCDVEINMCGQPIGKQDQYASAFGGLNFIEFNEDDTVFVNPIICLNETKRAINDNIIVFYTGITRSASEILKNQNKSYDENDKIEMMKKMVKLTYDLKKELENNNIDAFGHILHENWLLKRQITSGISNDLINDYYNKAIKAGAIGGKLMGAGGGGFLMFYAPKDKHESVKMALSGLKKIDIRFESEGSKIVFVH